MKYSVAWRSVRIAYATFSDEKIRFVRTGSLQLKAMELGTNVVSCGPKHTSLIIHAILMNSFVSLS